jgi:hypothetical protein
VTALRDTGQLANTVILFTSDNGYFHGEHRVPDGKERLYRPALRVPLLARGPRFPAGARVAAPVANVDLAPTIVALTGSRPSRVMDGRNLAAVAADPAAAAPRRILLEVGDNVGNPTSEGALTSRYLYAEHSTGEHELYDLATDPHQLVNRAGDPGHAAARQSLARDLDRLLACPAPSPAFPGDTSPPSVSGPGAHLFGLRTVQPGGVPLTLFWGGGDPGSGVAAYQVQVSVRAGAWSAVTPRSCGMTSLTRLFPPGVALALRARARDAVGNWSGWTAGPSFRPDMADDGATAVGYSAGWTRRAVADALGGGLSSSSTAGARATVRLTGTAIGVVSTRGPDQGVAEVWMDGVRVKVADLYHPVRQPRQMIHAQSLLPGAHDVQVRVTGNRHPRSGGTAVAVDGFVTLTRLG